MGKKIKVVLSGSGVLFPVHAGALIRLAELGYEIEEIAGVSGGSIVAAAIASGYEPNEQLVKLIKDTLPGKNHAIDYSIFSLFGNWGLVKGEKIEEMLEKHFAKTFSDTKIPLHVVTTNLSRKEVRIFSSTTDPNMPLSKAVRGSMSIPIIFAPLCWGGEYYVDGGWVSNFPINLFKDADNVIGIRFQSQAHSFSKISSVQDYVSALIDTPIAANMDEAEQDAKTAKYIEAQTSQSSLNFNITDADVDQMVADGKKAIDDAIKAGKL